MIKKNIYVSLAALVVFAFAASPIPAIAQVSATTKAAPVLSFSAKDVVLKPGETTKIDISVSGDDISNNAELVLTSNGIEISSIETMENCLSLNQTASKEGATLDIAQVTGDFAQNEVIASITIKADRTGIFSIKFSQDSRVNQMELGVTQDLTVTVSDSGMPTIVGIPTLTSSNTISIVGICLGAIIILIIVIAAFFAIKKNRKNKQNKTDTNPLKPAQ